MRSRFRTALFALAFVAAAVGIARRPAVPGHHGHRPARASRTGG